VLAFGKLISDAAWPIAVLTIALAFRETIIRLVGGIKTISHKEWTFRFDDAGLETRANLAASGAGGSLGPADLKSSTSPNRLRLLIAWSRVVSRLQAKVAGLAAPAGESELIEFARASERISGEQHRALLGLYAMRNLAVHGRDDDIDERRLREFETLASAVETVLQITPVSHEVAAGIVGQGELATMSIPTAFDRLEAEREKRRAERSNTPG
jgi:hypothetical protein